MSEATRKVAGWRFEVKKDHLLIRHCDQGQQFVDPPTIRHLVAQIRSSCPNDVTDLLSLLPSVDQLIGGVPWTIPVIDALYSRCEQLDFFSRNSLAVCLLKAEELFCRIVWWIAYREQDDREKKTRTKTLPSVQSLEKPLSSLLTIMGRQFPSLLSRAAADKRQLEMCLESLGCHGLVNCSQGLIRLQDASKSEMGKHEEKLRKSVISLKEFIEKANNNNNLANDPSTASHQRQMRLKLSEIFDRLKFNEYMEKVLTDAVTSNHLSSLLRISRKRVASDRLLIGLFNAFNRAAPNDFRIENIDPVIAELIVIFNNTYEKVLQLANFHDFDSGYSNESGSDQGICSLPKDHTDSSRSHSIPLSSPVTEHIYDTTEEVRSDLSEGKHSKLRPAKSTSHLDTLDISEMRRFHQIPLKITTEKDDTLKLRLHIEHLKNELSNARTQVQHLMSKGNTQGQERLWPEPDYPEATNYYNCSSQEDVQGLIRRFSKLFDEDREELMETLNSLPEFKGSEELQLKTILSVSVLTYRSVLDSVQKRMAKIWETIEEGDDKKETEEANMLDLALYRHMYRRAKSQHGMSNAKEVTTQIWNTLYDFPSLKTCTRFNRFILECVDVAWDLVAGIDGRYPRIRIDFEGSSFESEKHTRFEGSNHRLHSIQTFLWPGLIDQNTKRVLLKAVVLT